MATQPAFTPGPWEAHDVEGGVSIMPSPDRRYPDSFMGICTVYRFDGERSEAKVQANARLIAAAPDLLEALSWFINDIDDTHTKMVDFDANVERGRAAIAKATGAL